MTDGPVSYRTTEHDRDDLEVFPLPVSEDMLRELLTLVFTDHWRDIQFGTLIQGAAFEIAATRAPEIGYLDGYLTIDVGGSHLHLCIGPTVGSPEHPTDPELAARRQCAEAQLQRMWTDGAPMSWMFRMFNGDGDQQLTVLLPNPFLSSEQQPLDRPDWSRLELWDSLRARWLGLDPDPADRLGTGFVHV